MNSNEESYNLSLFLEVLTGVIEKINKLKTNGEISPFEEALFHTFCINAQFSAKACLTYQVGPFTKIAPVDPYTVFNALVFLISVEIYTCLLNPSFIEKLDELNLSIDNLLEKISLCLYIDSKTVRKYFSEKIEYFDMLLFKKDTDFLVKQNLNINSQRTISNINNLLDMYLEQTVCFGEILTERQFDFREEASTSINTLGLSLLSQNISEFRLEIYRTLLNNQEDTL